MVTAIELPTQNFAPTSKFRAAEPYNRVEEHPSLNLARLDALPTMGGLLPASSSCSASMMAHGKCVTRQGDDKIVRSYLHSRDRYKSLKALLDCMRPSRLFIQVLARSRREYLSDLNPQVSPFYMLAARRTPQNARAKVRRRAGGCYRNRRSSASASRNSASGRRWRRP